MLDELRPGAVLAGYTIGRKLGQGGMGAVFEARDAGSRVVALKVIAPELASDPGCVERFQREGRASSALSHPNVVKVHALGQERRLLFMVLELVSGGSLADQLKRRGAFAWREACALGAGIARGLAAVHAAGLVHRDLKPANVLVDQDGRPKLADFGLVRLVDRASKEALTRTGEMVGTAQYMAPEQVDSSRHVGPAADLYALGGVLFALLTGRPPFEGSGLGLVRMHLLESPRSPRDLVPSVPEDLAALVLELLRKDPAARPKDAETVARRLEALASSTTRERPRRTGWLVSGAAVALGALTLALAVAMRAGVASADAPQTTTTTTTTSTEPSSPTTEPSSPTTEPSPPTTTEPLSIVSSTHYAAIGVPITAISAAPGDDVLIGCADGRVLRLSGGGWRAVGAHEPSPREPAVKSVHTIARSPRGQRALSVGNDLSIHVLNLATKEETRLGDPLLAGGVQHNDTILCAAWIGERLELLAGGRRTTTERGDQRLVRWSVPDRTATELVDVAGGISALAVSRDGRLAVTGGEVGLLLRFELERDAKRTTLREGGRPRINAVAFTSDDEALAIDDAGELSLLSVADPRVLKTATMAVDPSPMRALAISPGRAFAATGDDGARVCVWDVKTLTLLLVQELHAATGALSFCTEADGATRLWIGTHDGEVLALELSPR